MTRWLLILLLLAGWPAASRAQSPASSADSAAVARTIARFHAALAAGDSAQALALLAEDVVVLEAGGAEDRAQYRAHHLPADMEYAGSVRQERSAVQLRVLGDVAWSTATSSTVGNYRGRPVDSAGAELMVLSRTPAGWRIRAIHWSSRPRPAR